AVHRLRVGTGVGECQPYPNAARRREGEDYRAPHPPSFRHWVEPPSTAALTPAGPGKRPRPTGVNHPTVPFVGCEGHPSSPATTPAGIRAGSCRGSRQEITPAASTRATEAHRQPTKPYTW